MINIAKFGIDAVAGVKKHFSNFNVRVAARQERI